VRFGPMFKRPPKRVLRKARQANGSRMFEAAEIRATLEAASTQLRAMILLGANAAYGNSDCASLPLEALDGKLEWATFPRPKTAVERRAKLWPETSEAMAEVLARRREPKDPSDVDLVFVTLHRRRWGNGVSGHPISHEFRKLLKSLGIYRPGVGFYGLRRSFRTVADECRDAPAIDLVMGHQTEGMGAIYVQRISDARLEAVANHVHKWLFGDTGR
jgi:integrase